MKDLSQYHVHTKRLYHYSERTKFRHESKEGLGTSQCRRLVPKLTELRTRLCQAHNQSKPRLPSMVHDLQKSVEWQKVSYKFSAHSVTLDSLANDKTEADGLSVRRSSRAKKTSKSTAAIEKIKYESLVVQTIQLLACRLLYVVRRHNITLHDPPHSGCV